MIISGVTLEEFERITRMVSRTLYDGNVVVVGDTARQISANRCSARLRVVSSYGYGARQSARGRHQPVACWHVYRDVLASLFNVRPEATVKTMFAMYKGRAGFEESYPATAYANIGSQWEPAYVEDLCRCDSDGPHLSEKPRRNRQANTNGNDAYRWRPTDAPCPI